MIISTKVERFKDYSELVRVVSRSEKSPATNRDLIQPLHYMMLVGTHIPDEFQLRLGALVADLFRNAAVVDAEVWQTDAGIWIADALVETGAGWRLRQGEGETPIEAFVNLVYDIQHS